MPERAENLARVAIYDPIRQNLRVTRYALYEIGFREIEAAASLSELRARLDDQPCDLVVIDAEEGGDVFAFVSALRNGRIGSNPFTVVFLTCWTRDEPTVRRALDSGADDLVARPFSASFLKERVNAAIERRKRFVVTSEYVGPDRRSAPREGAGEPRYLDAPNTLRAAAKGDWKALQACHERIKAVQDEVAGEKVRRLAVRIAADLELAEPADVAGEIALIKHIRELERLAGQVNAEAASIARALTRTLTDVEAQVPRKRWSIARELAQGVAVAAGDGDSRASGEIADLVRRMRGRADSVAPDGGVAERKGLNSAA